MRRVVVTRRNGRLVMRIEEHDGEAGRDRSADLRGGRELMGKKYDAWQQARQASKQAEGRLSDVRGGSTKQAQQEAITNREQASRNERDTYEQWRDDPAG